MIGALVPTLANLLTNETDVVRSVAPRLPLDVLREQSVRLPRPRHGVQVQAQVPAQVKLTFAIVVFLKSLDRLLFKWFNRKL